jgi:hypothetical protein
MTATPRILVASLVCFVISTNAAAQPSADLLSRAQAGDVLSDLLTYTSDRADARVTAMQDFIREIGKADAFAAFKPQAPAKNSMYFNQVFAGALDFVKAGGGKYADPALRTMPESELLDHLTTLQTYNINEFQHLTQQRHAADTMANFLESIGQFESYLKWAGKKFPGSGAAATQQTVTNSEQAAARMQNQIDTAHAMAWKRAQAAGVSQAAFDQIWKQHLEQYREAVAQKVAGVKALAGSMGQSVMAGSAPPPVPQDLASAPQSQAIWQAAAPPQQAAPPLPTSVNSKYTNAYYQNSNAFLWNNWGDPYAEVGYNYGGGGHHH